MKLSKLKEHFTGILLIGGVVLTLVACGGGGGGVLGSLGSSLQATLTGSAVDAAIPYASITITSGAPLNNPGATTIGAFAANASGVFTSSVTLPSSDVPIFGNAVDPNNSAVILSSYLGSSTALAAASGVLTSSNLPDLDITPVTTAALAVYAQVNAVSGVISYANLTPTTYATNLQQYNGDILAIAAAIKAVGDNLCTPAASSAVSSTTSLAATIAAASNLTSGNSTTLATAATTLGGNCATVLATLPQQISADPVFSPGLYVGDVIDAGVSGVVSSVPVTTGVSSVPVTYTLQGVIAESGMTTSFVAVSSVAASVFNDATVAVDSSGNISSSDSNVSGTLVGNLINLTVTNGSQQYSLRGKIGVIQTTLVSGGTAYSIQGGGTNTSSNVLTNFTAVLAPAGVTPAWNGNTAPSTTACSSGYLIRLNAYGSGIGGGSVAECVVPSATGWSMSPSTLTVSYMGEGIASSTPPSLTAPTWSEVSASPFILSAPASFTSSGNATTSATTTTGTIYYVMGTTSVVFVSSLGNNSLMTMNGNTLTQIAEAVVSAISNPTVSGNTDSNGNNAASAVTANTGDSGNNANRNRNYH